MTESNEQEKRARKMQLERDIRTLEVQMDRLGGLNTNRHDRELAEILDLLGRYEKEYASFQKDKVEPQPQPQPCICDYPQNSKITVAQRDAIDGHFNQAGGYCCAHHGNTCGYCYQYDR